MIHTPPPAAPEPGAAYLASTPFFDYDKPDVRAFAEQTVAGARSDRERAVKLYYAVRDRWRYDPFGIRLAREPYVASNVLAGTAGFCIPKAILLVALARAVGIPTAYGSSDVVNHLQTEKLKQKMGGKALFIHHGYAVLHLEGKWVRAAPAFNIELCTRFGVRPTEFDGSSDAVFQQYDAYDRRHMEYVKDHGMWSDFPYDIMVREFRAFYPASLFADWSEDEPFEEGKPVAA